MTNGALYVLDLAPVVESIEICQEYRDYLPELKLAFQTVLKDSPLVNATIVALNNNSSNNNNATIAAPMDDLCEKLGDVSHAYIVNAMENCRRRVKSHPGKPLVWGPSQPTNPPKPAPPLPVQCGLCGGRYVGDPTEHVPTCAGRSFLGSQGSLPAAEGAPGTVDSGFSGLLGPPFDEEFGPLDVYYQGVGIPGVPGMDDFLGLPRNSVGHEGHHSYSGTHSLANYGNTEVPLAQETGASCCGAEPVERGGTAPQWSRIDAYGVETE